jgi:hypothetical protein
MIIRLQEPHFFTTGPARAGHTARTALQYAHYNSLRSAIRGRKEALWPLYFCRRRKLWLKNFAEWFPGIQFQKFHPCFLPCYRGFLPVVFSFRDVILYRKFRKDSI